VTTVADLMERVSTIVAEDKSLDEMSGDCK
jgi:hypothetical protein